MPAARLCLAGILICAVLLIAAPAQAGGQLWDLDGQPSGQAYYEPGSTMTARGGLYLWPDGRGRNDRGAHYAGPEHGPFNFYVSKTAAPDGWGPHAPPLPKDAQLVGEVIFKRRDDVTWDVSGTFALPDLAPGNYMLHHCNDPCTRQLGDIMSTPFTVIEDVDQAPLWKRLEAAQQKLRERSEDIRTLQLRIDQLSDQMGNSSGRVRDEVESMRTELRSMRQEIKDLRSQRGSGIAHGSLAGLALGTLLLAAWRLRAR